MIKTLVDTLLIGGPKIFRADGVMSAMARMPTNGPVYLTKTGFTGDQVGDPKLHGGVDKAVHLYPAEHYPYWNVTLDGHPYLQSAGAFGENISACGLTEKRVKIGDRFRMGTAILEISQGRQPCWKIDHHFGTHGMAGAVIKSGRSGYYFRVIEEGYVGAGDIVEQIDSAPHDWTVERAFRLLVGGGHRAPDAADQLRILSELETLAQDWRNRAAALSG